MTLLSLKRLLYKKIIDYKIINKKKFLINGRNIILTDIKGSQLLSQISIDGFESYENEVVILIKNYNWQTDVFLDVGANVGFYSILVEIYFNSSSRIIAVEPFAKNIEYLKKIRKINNLSFTIIEKAISDSTDNNVSFYYPTAKTSSLLSSSASLINSFKGTGGIFNNLPFETINVETTTLPSILNFEFNSALIKLDCEGNELNILQSSESILCKGSVDWIVEIGINDNNKGDLFALMKKYGYDAYLITNAGLIREDRPLTLPYPHRKNRTIWKNHFFTRKGCDDMKKFSVTHYGYWV